MKNLRTNGRNFKRKGGGGPGLTTALRRAALVLCLLFPCIFSAGAAEEPTQYRLGTASPGGAYHDFGNALIAALQQGGTTPFRLVNIATQGSVDNLERLQQGELDLAIVQNDIAYSFHEGRHGYSAFQGFSAVLPLFEEYVQVLVRRDSDIRVLGDLQHRVVSIGPKRSGSYHNALELLREIGLRSGIDYEARYLSTADAIEQLLGGTVDAVIHTGAALPIKEAASRQALRALPVSPEVVAALKARSSYYAPGEFPLPSGMVPAKVPTIVLRAYLVASDRLSEKAVHHIVESLSEIWPTLQSSGRYRLASINEIIRRSPVPLHPGVKRFLRQTGHLKTEYLGVLWTALVILVVGGTVVWAHRTASSYDRLGNIRVGCGSWRYRIATQISRVSVFIVVMLFLAALTAALVTAIRYFETQYAREMNLDNAFANVDFSDALLWMFMFMGAGEPGGMFPMSTWGKILATSLPFIGITSILGLLFMAAERHRRLSAERKRGMVIPHVQGHVLVCGWNEKVPGLVWALTSRDAPERKKVVIVAELEGDMPLERHHFDPGRVFYCRGDSADYKALERAHVEGAEAAVVVAGLKKRKGGNIRSVLSAMALKGKAGSSKQKKGNSSGGIFVAAELLYENNQCYFEASGADAVVPTAILVDRVAALASVSPPVVDFIMDMFTYDDHSEIYSMPADNVEKGKWRALLRRAPWLGPAGHRARRRRNAFLVGRTLGEAREWLAQGGVNLVGLVRASYQRTTSLVDHQFGEASSYVLALADDNLEHQIAPGDTLLYIADNRDDIHLPGGLGDAPVSAPSPSDASPGLWPPEKRRILLVGDIERCLGIRSLLENAPNVETRILAEEGNPAIVDGVHIGPFSLESSWQQAGLTEMDTVLVLAQPVETARAVDLTTDYGEADARTILTARFARKFAPQPAKAPEGIKIIAEMAGRNSRPLFKDAGVDVVIPCNLLVERILAKLVYSRGLVCDLLMALLSMSDGVYLHSLRLDPVQDSALIGRTFIELMERMPHGVQLMGLLPSAETDREELLTNKDDFECHFIAHPDRQTTSAYRSKAGDELVVIVDRNRLEGRDLGTLVSA